MSTTKSAGLTRDVILAAEDMKSERVEVPEWGGHVFVRQMTAGDRDKFDAFVYEQSGASIRAWLVGMCAVDGEGKRMFSDADLEALAGKNGEPMDRIFQVARKLNKLLTVDIEDAEKN